MGRAFGPLGAVAAGSRLMALALGVWPLGTWDRLAGRRVSFVIFRPRPTPPRLARLLFLAVSVCGRAPSRRFELPSIYRPTVGSPQLRCAWCRRAPRPRA